jgi:hypothetical protein
MTAFLKINNCFKSIIRQDDAPLFESISPLCPAAELISRTDANEVYHKLSVSVFVIANFATVRCTHTENNQCRCTIDIFSLHVDCTINEQMNPL